MLLIQDVRDNYNDLVARLDKRGIAAAAIFDAIIAKDDERKAIQKQLDDSLNMSNTLAKQIGEFFKSGNQEEALRLKAETATLKETTKALQTQLQAAVEAVNALLIELPNAPHHSVAKGVSAEDNEVVDEWLADYDLPETAKPHWELCQELGIVDFETGVKITGAGFPVYVNKGARLQRALINFFLDYNTKAGYTEYQPPYFINQESGYGTGQLPDKEGQMYHMVADNLFAIPTAEVPITNMFRDTIINTETLPIKCTAYTPCFRREAGSYGKDVRGLNRLHQFDKVEIVVLSHPEKSYDYLTEMVAHVGGLLKLLGLKHRVLRLCGGDMGFTSALTYDFEVWSAAQGRWLEVSSVSNFETFQSNRLKCRFKSGKDKPQLVHTLNGSSLALPRVMAALLENYQTENGIRIPEALVPYTGFTAI